jgi:M6 family metalloprotease-like protein
MSAPFFNKRFTFTQPDGSKLEVIGSGNQRDAVFATLDGFTVVEDPATGYYEYAAPALDGQDIQPSGVTALSADPRALGLIANARPGRATAKARQREGRGLPAGGTRWEARRRDARMSQLRAAAGIAPAPPTRQTVGTYLGLCLLVEFPDVPATIDQQEVERFCNQEGYKGFGNNGSVADYFSEASGKKLRYTNVVTPNYRTKHERAYYTNESVQQPVRARELIRESLDYWHSQGFDFSSLTVDNQSFVYAVNVFYSGPVVNNWAKGLWPHSYYLASPYELAPGKRAHDYQITNIGAELSLGTFCHENGHMICDFPDLYDYGYESRGVGVYCLMCGGTRDEKNPGHIGAYLKRSAGWGETIALSAGTFDANAGANQFFIHRKNATEYFIVENRVKGGRDSLLPSSGLAIWHVDEHGSNNDEQMTTDHHYECSLVQADGRTDLEKGANDGDGGDLFSAATKTTLSDATVPHSKWWDGSPSGLNVSGIGAAGSAVTFVVG